MISVPPRLTPYDWFLLISLSILWGGAFFFGKVAIAELPPLILVFLRVSGAAVLLMLVVAVLRLPFQGARIWLAFVIMGGLNNVIPMGLIFWAQKELGAGMASVLNATTPLFSLLLGAALGAEALGGRRLLGILLGIAGVAVMVGPAAWSGSSASVLPSLAILVAAVTYAFAGAFARRFFKGVPPLVLAMGQLTGSTLILAPVVFFQEGLLSLPMPSTQVIWAVGLLTVFSTALAYILFFRLLTRAGPTNALLVTLLIPVSANVLGIVFLGESVGLGQALGMVGIGLGLLIIDGRLLTLFKTKGAPV
ncbi:DMT family transporter [Lacibacterium aquatile]|uniref:DMT family transporter n=1 Tax=Lacibacterium aquatile TaxID=1168082 RepID=A0ABW5DKK4_9PROT